MSNSFSPTNNKWQLFLSIQMEEIKAVCSDWMVLGIVLLVPAFYCILFAFIYSGAVLHDIPVVVCDQDNSSISRSLVEDLDRNEKVKVVARVTDMQQVENLVQSGKAKGALVIPPGLAQHLLRGEPSTVLTIIDGSNLIVAFNLRKGLVTVTRTFKAGITMQLLSASGMLSAQASSIMQAVSFREQVWFNPTYNYFNYIMFGTLVMALHQVLLMVCCLVVARDRRKGIWETQLEQAGPALLLLGKAFPYLAVGLAQEGIIFLMLHCIWGLPAHGSVWVLLLGGLIFSLVVIGLGLLLSTLSHDEFEANAYVMMVGLPAFLVAGYSWPSYLMVLPIRGLAKLLPTTWMLQMFRTVAVRGGGLTLVLRPLAALTILALATCTAVYCLWNKEKKERKGVRSLSYQLID